MANHRDSFHSIYSHGFLRAAVCLPQVALAEPAVNARRTIELARRASERGAAVAVFPELGLSSYSNEDLFFQDALLDASEEALATVIETSRELTPLLFVGLPLRVDGKLFNCAAAIYRGQLLGITPKSYLPNYREFYEKRHFTSGRDACEREVRLLGDAIPFGTDLIFHAPDYPGFTVHAEICEDLWVPIPPSTYAAMAGTFVLANLSASDVTIGKADYRKSLAAAQSGKCVAAYLYTGVGPGESTTDLAWDGQGLIYENNELLAEASRFPEGPEMLIADLDLERLRQDRARLSSFHDCAAEHHSEIESMRWLPFSFEAPVKTDSLERRVDRFPYVPSDPATLDERCYEAYNIQVHGLLQRLRATGIEKVVIGVSGGLDSTQALIVAARTFDRLGLPRKNILGFTLPGFATSERTRDNACHLMEALGISAEEIDIRPSCEQMLRDLGHPFARGERGPDVYDVTFENVQAGERTSHLFRLANARGGMVLGTGDLSELALGWTTYGVGDQMSHYNVNTSVPKTLIQHLVRWVIESHQFDDETSRVLQSILDTEISPELIPAEDSDRLSAQPAQSTEELIGPYELHDFFLYFLTRYGFRPSKVAFLASWAWGLRTRGSWPETVPEELRHDYDLATIKRWLEVFLLRFFQLSQFKRSAMPNGPKVGSGGALSPRGDWRAPSDAPAEVWLDELRRHVP